MIKVSKLGDAALRRRRVAIGTFDGVHVGHRAVIRGADTVLTFEPHPLEVLHPAAAPKLLMPFVVKRDVLDGLGVEELIVIPFDREFTKITAESFIEDILISRLGAEEVSVGDNFRFGTKARGTPEMLARRPEFKTRVEQARKCLGVPFMIEGTVIAGDRRGRELGFPTANIVPDDRLVIPGHGVFAAFANGLPAAVNVGVRPTFESGRGLLIETHLIDQDVDLYGRELRVAFVERLRGERRFDSAEELIEQMKRDVEATKRICASFQRPERG